MLYQSLSTLCNMLNNKNKKDYTITFWATDVLCMNDPKEMSYGEGVVKNFIRQYESDEYIIEDDRISSIIDDSSDIEIFKKLGNFFVISLSKESDSLPMWQTYGDKGRGVNIIINDAKIKNDISINKNLSHIQRAKDFSFQALHQLVKKKSIEYGCIARKGLCGSIITNQYKECIEKLHQEENPMKRDFLKMQTFADMLFIGIQSLKSASYSYENEERLYHIPTNNGEIKYRVNGLGHIIPFCEVEMPIQDIAGITIGPAFDQTNIEPLKQMLSDGGINDELHTSKIVYRNF